MVRPFDVTVISACSIVPCVAGEDSADEAGVCAGRLTLAQRQRQIATNSFVERRKNTDSPKV